MAEDEIHDATGKVSGFIKHKVGPLEVWQWAAGLAGLLVAYVAYRNHVNGASSNPSLTSQPSVSTVPPTDLGATGTQDLLSGQLQDVQTSLGQLGQQVAAITASQTPGSSTGATGGTGAQTGASLLSLAGQANPAAGDVSYWQTYLSGHGLNQTVQAIENSPGAVGFAQSNPTAFVQAQYQTVLGEGPSQIDQAGLNSWLQQLGSNPTPTSVNQETASFLNAAQKQTTGTAGTLKPAVPPK